MSYFAMPYRVLFHDTMAYGSHHFMTNFKFQCVIREHLLFDNSLDVTTLEGKREFDKVILRMAEADIRQSYNRPGWENVLVESQNRLAALKKKFRVLGDGSTRFQPTVAQGAGRGRRR